MATTPISSHQFVPLHLSGNTTETQNQMLMAFLDEAVQHAYRTVIEQLRQMFQQRRFAGQERDARLPGGGLQSLVVRGGEGQHRNVAGGGSFLD